MPLVTPRKRRVSRNDKAQKWFGFARVTPRKRRVSRNAADNIEAFNYFVTPRKRRVSRNFERNQYHQAQARHASQEACE